MRVRVRVRVMMKTHRLRSSNPTLTHTLKSNPLPHPHPQTSPPPHPHLDHAAQLEVLSVILFETLRLRAEDQVEYLRVGGVRVGVRVRRCA